MTDRREFARQHAEAFNARTLEEIGKVLSTHSGLLVEFACEMQARVDAAELLIAEVAASRRGPRRNRDKDVKHVSLSLDLLKRIDASVAESKGRSQ